MSNRIYRSNSDIVLGGVCAGLGEYFDIDPTIIRIIWAIAFFSGFGFLAYIIAWIVIPRRPSLIQPQPQYKAKSDQSQSTQSSYIASSLNIDEETDANGAYIDIAAEGYTDEEISDRNQQRLNDNINHTTTSGDRSSKIIGMGLIVIGAGYLAKKFFGYINIDEKLIFSAMLIALGVFFVFRKK